MTKDDVDAVVDVFTPDGSYSAFGDTYRLEDFPALVAAAPKGLFLVGPPVLELDGDGGTGQQPLCFVEQTTHAMRIGWYTDSYRRTADGWRLHTRSMTFLRRSGARDAGRPHDPTRPPPSTAEGAPMELDEFRVSLDDWLDEHERRARSPRTRARRRSTSRWRSWPRSSAWPSTPAGCAGGGPSASAGWAARACCAPTSARRSPAAAWSSRASTP